jgi:GNAT superfamily N-acetyltransferase
MSVGGADPVFRRAKAEDLPAIVAMLADDELGATRENPSLPLDPRYQEAFAAIDTDANQFLLVAEVEGQVAGSLQLTFIAGIARFGLRRGQIEAVRVSRRLRGGGVGRAMFVFAIEECRRRGCALVQLTTDKSRTDAHRFYAGLGFVDSHEGFKLSL